MVRIEIHVSGLDRVQERLTKLSASLHDFRDALNALGKGLIMFYGNNVFVSQGTALGKRWTPLAPATDTYKARHWPGRGPLVRTGAMQSGFYSEATADTLFISNSVPYFPYHQMGTTPGGGRGHNIPARPMIGVNATVESMIKAALEADIRAKIASTKV